MWAMSDWLPFVRLTPPELPPLEGRSNRADTAGRAVGWPDTS